MIQLELFPCEHPDGALMVLKSATADGYSYKLTLTILCEECNKTWTVDE